MDNRAHSKIEIRCYVREATICTHPTVAAAATEKVLSSILAKSPMRNAAIVRLSFLGRIHARKYSKRPSFDCFEVIIDARRRSIRYSREFLWSVAYTKYAIISGLYDVQVYNTEKKFCSNQRGFC